MLKKVLMNRSMTSTGTNTAEGSATKGSISTQTSYNYPASASNLTSAPKYTTKSDSWYEMDSAVAVTSYAVNNTANPRTTTVTLPDGTKNKTSSYNTSDWKDGMPDKTEFLAPNNAVLSKQDMTWEQGFNDAPRVTQILSTDEKNQTKKQTFDYGNSSNFYNQVVWTYDYGYSNNLLRKTYTTYENSTAYRGIYSGSEWQSGLHIFNLPLTTEVQNASNVRQSRMDYTYDVGTLTTRSSVPNFDSAGYNNSTKKRGNATKTRTYTKASNLTGYIDYLYTYDVLGNNLTAETNCCQQMKTTYTSTYKYAYPTSVRRGATSGTVHNTSSATYDFNTGLVTMSTDYNGRNTTATYDTIGRPTQVTLQNGAKTIYTYSPDTLTTTQTAKLNTNVIVSQGTSIVNGRGQARISKLLTGASTETASQVKYDIMGRQYQVSSPHPATSSPTKWTTYAYDNLSRVTQTTAPDGSTNKTFYNEITKPSSGSSTVGNTVRSQDAWGRERWARSDDWGRLVEVVEPKDTGNGSVIAAGNLKTSYAYDSVDQLTKITQGSQIREFKYDSLGRMLAQKLAEQDASITDSGVYVGASGSGRKWSDYFTYDDRSNLTQRIDARGVKTNFVYNSDALNRLQSINFDKTGASGTIHEAPDITYTYMSSGDKERIYTAASAGVSTETYTYDTEGRVSNYKMSLTGRTSYPMETSYLYDTANRLTEVRYPAQYGMSGNPRKEVNVTYDQTSRLKDLKVNNVAQMDQISYNDFGQATSIRIGGGAANPLTEQYSFDANTGLMTNQKVKRGSTSLMDLSYYYARDLSKGSLNGKTGNLTKIINNLDRNKDRKYEYDTLGRLIKAKGGVAAGASGVTANWDQTYTYDRYGNKKTTAKSGITANSVAIPLDGLASQTYAAATNRITTANHEYDNAGNMTRGKAPDGSFQKFEYDEAGRIKIIKTDAGAAIETNTYGQSRERLKKTNADGSNMYYAWGGSNVLAEYVETSSQTNMPWSKSYIYAGSRLLSTATKNGSSEKLEYHHPDRLGTKMVSDPVAVTNKEQATLPFGTEIAAETQATSNQRFTSYDRSGATGLDYAVNRTYNSGQSRFTQVDPIGMASTSVVNPQSMNLFAYVGNDPVGFVDPSGLNERIIFIYPTACQVVGEAEDGSAIYTCSYAIHIMEIGGGGTSGEPGGGGGNGGKPKKKENPCSIRVRAGIPSDSDDYDTNNLSPDNKLKFNSNGKATRKLGPRTGPRGFLRNVEIVANVAGNRGWKVSQSVIGTGNVNGSALNYVIYDDGPAAASVDGSNKGIIYAIDAPGIARSKKNNNGTLLQEFTTRVTSADGKSECVVKWTQKTVVKNNKIVKSEFWANMPTYNGKRIDGK